ERLPRAGPAPQRHRPCPVRGAPRAARRTRLPARRGGARAAQRRQPRPPRRARLRGGRHVAPDRLEARELARRRAPAEGPCAGARRGTARRVTRVTGPPTRSATARQLPAAIVAAPAPRWRIAP